MLFYWVSCQVVMSYEPEGPLEKFAFVSPLSYVIVELLPRFIMYPDTDLAPALLLMFTVPFWAYNITAPALLPTVMADVELDVDKTIM